MRVETALQMIRDHGHKAYVCAEGIVAYSHEWVDSHASYNSNTAQEAWCEVPHVFETYKLNADMSDWQVYVADVRDWLGY